MKLSDILAREIPGTAEQALSPAWFAARAGKITGSKVPCVAPWPNLKKPGQYISPRVNMSKDYYNEKLWEMMNGRCYEVEADQLGMERMAHGTKYESVAIALFERKFGFTVQKCGAIRPDTNEAWGDRFCVSPDGLIVGGPNFDPNDIGIAEVKCPGFKNHVKFLESNEVPQMYFGQVQAEIMVAGATHGYFISYHPSMPKQYQILAIKVKREDEYIDSKLIPSVKRFLNKLDKGFARINSNCSVTICQV